MKNRAVIGILAGVDEELSLSLLRHYVSCIETVNAFPLIIPYIENESILDDVLAMCDGIMLTGGADVSPETYNEAKKDYCGNVCKTRDEYELLIFEKALYSFKPILAICRGAQLVNVALGGTLYQDIQVEYQNAICHLQTEPKFTHSHTVTVLDNTPLFELLNQSNIKANSFHHQCVKELGRLLEPMALAQDGIIEAFYMPSYRYLRAYQWHPERLYEIDENQFKIFLDFANECSKKNEEAYGNL